MTLWPQSAEHLLAVGADLDRVDSGTFGPVGQEIAASLDYKKKRPTLEFLRARSQDSQRCGL